MFSANHKFFYNPKTISNRMVKTEVIEEKIITLIVILTRQWYYKLMQVCKYKVKHFQKPAQTLFTRQQSPGKRTNPQFSIHLNLWEAIKIHLEQFLPLPSRWHYGLKQTFINIMQRQRKKVLLWFYFLNLRWCIVLRLFCKLQIIYRQFNYKNVWNHFLLLPFCSVWVSGENNLLPRYETTCSKAFREAIGHDVL